MRHILLLLFPLFALGQGAVNDYIFYQKPASGPLVVRPVTPTVGRLMGWPSSISAPASIILGTGLSLSGSTLNATASSAWGTITGTLSAQTDLQTALDLKLTATTAASTYQPLDSDLTSWGAITRASGFDTFAATPSSANLASMVTNETGSGSLVFASSPTFVTKLTTPELRASSLTGDLIVTNQSGTTAIRIAGSGAATTVTFPSATTVIFPSATPSTIAHFNGSSNLTSLPLDTYPSLTELSYVKGVTSAIQTQLTATTNADNLTSGNLALARIDQAGATSGQALAWNGSAWAPATISSGATLAANTYTGLQQFSGTTHAGLRLNNLTTAERDALTGAAGMAIWNTTDGRLQLHNGSAWSSGMVRLSGDTMTGALTISSASSLSLGTAGSAVGSIGFRNATSGTVTLEPPTGALGTYTVTLPGVASTLATLGVNTFTAAQVISSGSLTLPTTLAFTTGTNSLIADATGITYFNAGTNRIRFDYNQLQLCQSAFLAFSTGTAFNTGDLFLSRAAAASLQLGSNTATASATAIAQTIKGPNATGTTSTGGSLTLAGGTGTSAGGAVIITTAATTTQTERARFSSAGVTIGASGTAIASVISNTATLDFPSTNSHEASAQTITVTGAAVGDVVAIGIPNGSVGTTGVFFGWVSAADTVTIRYCNTHNGGAVDPASGTFRATVIKH